ncbi:MAG: flavin reductase family protein [Candidatus Bathyarchaeia archaeon]|nr:flavin reductase [Candidatus Bathyarchaeota archaeon]
MSVQTVLEKIVNAVTIVTSKKGKEINGLTVAWVTQVSFNPPLVIVSIGKERYTREFIDASKVFAINILSENQKDLAKLFGFYSGRNKNKFDGVDYEIKKSGSPILKNCAAYLDCKVIKAIEVGDHIIYVGEILEAGIKSNEKPLIYNPQEYF